MKVKFPLATFLLLILTASCSQTDIQEEQSLFTEDNQQITEEVSLTATAFENEVLAAVNDYRASQNLNTLQFGNEAYIDAEGHTMYMINEGKLSHDNFNARAANVSEKTNAAAVAENVAKNYSTAEEVVTAWLASPSHRSTIEGDFTHSSITAREAQDGTLYYTQIFYKK
ncbi:MAG: CAP domain-containing protein [Allomuricauda sp.]|nr:MAG: CAP domain-containing protein [Allomuricauda sp.]